DGILAYVGKGPGGEYKPFYYKQSLLAADVEISDDMFIVSKDTAEAYLKTASAPGFGTATTATPPQPQPPGSTTGNPPIDETTEPPETGQFPEQLTFAGMSWTGEIPPQKWMNFYTKVLSKFASGPNALKLKLSVEVSPEGGLSKQKIEETKSALRELGLSDS